LAVGSLRNTILLWITWDISEIFPTFCTFFIQCG
jgi:hypothetical protein